MSNYASIPLAVATMHGKEKVIAPAFANLLKTVEYSAIAINTDVLGTFAGEVPRTLSPIDAAKQKCLMAVEKTGCPLVVANEGSFGPHPALYLVPAAHEVMVFYDAHNQLFVTESDLSLKTNFDGTEVKSWDELHQFAQKSGFPDHRLILRKSKNQLEGLTKAIGNWHELDSVFYGLMSCYGQVFVETDMRAHYNPTRMHHIAQLASKLAKRVATNCAKCGTPGFGLTKYIEGLPCAVCLMPTRSPKAEVHTCAQCNYTLVIDLIDRNFEKPDFCDQCNP